MDGTNSFMGSPDDVGSIWSNELLIHHCIIIDIFSIPFVTLYATVTLTVLVGFHPVIRMDGLDIPNCSLIDDTHSDFFVLSAKCYADIYLVDVQYYCGSSNITYR